MLIHNKGNYIRHIGAMLIPGVTRLSPSEAKAFQQAAKLPLNKKLIEAKEIEIVKEGDTESDEVPSVSSISELNADKAILLIKDTFNLELLGAWGLEESEGKKRKTVLDAINEQIESIENPPEDTIVDKE